MIIMTSWRRFQRDTNIPAEWSTIIATPIIANKTNDYVTKDTKQVNRGE